MVLFNRVKSTTVTEQSDGLLEVRSCFIDSFHEINLALYVDRTEMQIVDAKADMVRTPHLDCIEAGGEAANLVGIKIGPGARKAILQAVGHAHGCTHLADMALDAIKGAIQANFKVQKRDLSPEERYAKFAAQLGGTCHHWTLADTR